MCAAVEKSHEILTPSLSITNLAMSEPIDDDQILVVYRISGKKSDVSLIEKERGRIEKAYHCCHSSVLLALKEGLPLYIAVNLESPFKIVKLSKLCFQNHLLMLMYI